MKRFIFAFRRRVWCPKWTPLSGSWRMVTTAMVRCSSESPWLSGGPVGPPPGARSPAEASPAACCRDQGGRRLTGAGGEGARGRPHGVVATDECTRWPAVGAVGTGRGGLRVFGAERLADPPGGGDEQNPPEPAAGAGSRQPD